VNDPLPGIKEPSIRRIFGVLGFLAALPVVFLVLGVPGRIALPILRSRGDCRDTLRLLLDDAAHPHRPREPQATLGDGAGRASFPDSDASDAHCA
jgi:hypothetical protein